MTKSEYQELVEFLAGKFGRIDERFNDLEQEISAVGVSTEQNRHHIQLVIERVDGLESRMERKLEKLRTDMNARFREQRSLFSVRHRPETRNALRRPLR